MLLCQMAHKKYWDPRISTIFLKEAYFINMIKALDSF